MATSPLSLKPKDAIAFFRSKALRKGFDYRDVWQQEHAQAFTVAKAMQVDILEDIRQALDDALVQGQTFEHFKKQLTPILQAKGWWGKKEMVDPETKQTVLAQLGSDRRLKTIFQTNMRQAYNAGNWQRSWATRSLLPYLIYHHNSERYPRPEHQAWDGLCLPVEHPFWQTHYPQCAWGCKCSTESVSRRMIGERGLKVSADKDIPTFPKKQYINPRTGERQMVEQGIDPAFSFNIGQSPLRPITARPAAIDRNQPVKDIEQVTKPFFDIAGIDPKAGRIVTDRDGWPLAINDQLFIDSSGKPALPTSAHNADVLPLVARTLKTPDKIDWLWSSVIHKSADAAAVEAVLAEASGATATGTAVRLRQVIPETVAAARSNGIDIDGFSHTLDVSFVRHARRQHGNDKSERNRGQRGITDADLRALPGLMSAPDFVAFGMKNAQGNEVMAYSGPGDNGQLVLLTEIRKGKKRLAAHTLWKFPDTADAEKLASSLGLNVRNDAGATGRVVDLRGKIKPPKDALVRRYTKRLDNQQVTVDFSAGAWTYDVH